MTETTTSPLWAWTNTFPAALTEDGPLLEEVLANEHAAARWAAAEQGYTLVGEPQVANEPVVLMDDWSAAGPALVSLNTARQAGYEGEATHFAYRLQFVAEPLGTP